MDVTPGKFIFSMMDSEVFGITDIDQDLVASPTIAMDNALN